MCNWKQRERRQTPREEGFTLVELLVVISIIALLISILLPSLRSAREQAKRVVCSTQIKNLTTAMLTYAVENKDEVPRHRGSEPNYIYLKAGQSVFFPDAWHLGEILMPQLNMEPIRRGTDGAPSNDFSDEEQRRTANAGKIFYCPSTGNAVDRSPGFATWLSPKTGSAGAFMDYAQFWHYVAAETTELRGDIVPVQSGYVVLDDQQDEVKEPSANTPIALFRMPYNVSQNRHRQLPNSGLRSEVPLFGEYMVSFNRTRAQLKTDYANGSVSVNAGNHAWTGHTSGSRKKVVGGNFGYVDGHVEWRSSNEVMPRLIIDRRFQGGSIRPAYWW